MEDYDCLLRSLSIMIGGGVPPGGGTEIRRGDFTGGGILLAGEGVTPGRGGTKFGGEKRFGGGWILSAGAFCRFRFQKIKSGVPRRFWGPRRFWFIRRKNPSPAGQYSNTIFTKSGTFCRRGRFIGVKGTKFGVGNQNQRGNKIRRLGSKNNSSIHLTPAESPTAENHPLPPAKSPHR